ncbi:MAG: hypothetical protein ACPGSM_10820 [Thiolinea sp.]
MRQVAYLPHVQAEMKDETTKRNIRKTVIFLVLLTMAILGLFVYSVIQQGPGV